MEDDRHDDDLAADTGRHVPILRQLFNLAGCVLCLPLYWLLTVHCRYPVTLDLFTTIALTELTRFVNEGRRMNFYAPRKGAGHVRNKLEYEKVDDDVERQPAPTGRLDCMATVVGWREDPELFTRALQSYRDARGCVFMLVGIDGDEAGDQDMVDVFNEVYPEQSRVIHIPEPLGEVAQQVRSKVMAMRQQYGQDVDEKECDEVALRHCIQLARTILDQQQVNLGSLDGVRHICLRQRHLHKKGIMFTTYIFALVIADILGIEFLWSSDSDTLVLPDSLERTVDIIAADRNIGGASSGLTVHNGNDSVVTSLAMTVYWGELYLTRSTPAATATSDCQSGPSTAFRLAALPPILVPWYMQTIMGKRMIINEDRHLTTNLLARGWGVVFASDVLTITDTPTTLERWLKQQVRWARATHIESLLQPHVYRVNHPLLFYSMARRELGPLVAALAILWYFLTARQLLVISARDVALRVLLSAAYNVARNPHRLGRGSLRWVVPGIFFYHVPLPAVHLWSMLTLTADGWGTSMRAGSELARRDGLRKAWFETGFFVVWMGVVAGCLARWFAAHHHLVWAHEMVVMALSFGAASFLAYRLTIGNAS